MVFVYLILLIFIVILNRCLAFGKVLIIMAMEKQFLLIVLYFFIDLKLREKRIKNLWGLYS